MINSSSSRPPQVLLPAISWLIPPRNEWRCDTYRHYTTWGGKRNYVPSSRGSRLKTGKKSRYNFFSPSDKPGNRFFPLNTRNRIRGLLSRLEHFELNFNIRVRLPRYIKTELEKEKKIESMYKQRKTFFYSVSIWLKVGNVIHRHFFIINIITFFFFFFSLYFVNDDNNNWWV